MSNYQGEPYVQPRVSYGKKREAHAPGIGEFERKPGDVVYDATVSPEAFTVSDPAKARP